jgi:hypothetical protein
MSPDENHGARGQDCRQQTVGIATQIDRPFDVAFNRVGQQAKLLLGEVH